MNNIKNLVDLLGAREVFDIIHLAKKQTKLEVKWKRSFEELIVEETRKIVAAIQRTGSLKTADVDFSHLLMMHSHEVLREGILSTKPRAEVRSERLAAPPPGRVPKSLKDLRTWWDYYKKTGKLPRRQKDIADRFKKDYLKKIQSVWERYGDEFRTGDAASQAAVVKKIMEAADVSFARAKTIVETETTYYFNKSRREIYGQSPDVTHFLFMAVRDHATTKWCKTRHALVYKKDDPILDKETPPIHWNCRSELLPLTPLNPSHKKIIEDKGRARRNNRCEPLPTGWTAR